MNRSCLLAKYWGDFLQKWLGANVNVLSGVTLCTGSVAAADAIVTRSIPVKAICMGVPARVSKMRNDLSKDEMTSTSQ